MKIFTLCSSVGSINKVNLNHKKYFETLIGPETRLFEPLTNKKGAALNVSKLNIKEMSVKHVLLINTNIQMRTNCITPSSYQCLIEVFGLLLEKHTLLQGI